MTSPTLTAEVWVMSSQIGYDQSDNKVAMVRSDQPDRLSTEATFTLHDDSSDLAHQGQLVAHGERWAAHWWEADFSSVLTPGRYTLHIHDGDEVIAESNPIDIGEQLLWEASYPVIGSDYLKTRSQQARTGVGWRDCGSDLQEFSSHAVCVDGIADVIKLIAHKGPEDQLVFLQDQLIRGCDYMARLQDKAEVEGLGRGVVIHEDRDRDVVTGNIAKAAAVFARVSRLIQTHNPEKSAEYLERAKLAFDWLEDHGPVDPVGEQDFFAAVHGAPKGSAPPDGQWMTRDLVTMTRAAFELCRAGEADYQDRAVAYADLLMQRQVPEDEAEHGYFGHFYTYDHFDSFDGIRFTEKANIHCGAWSKEGRLYNKGGHYPHYLLPLIDMTREWPDHPDAERWKQTLHRFAHGYLLPACRSSPFLILPAGVDREHSLVHFGSWYHGHNNIYAFTASLALELGELFDDPQFREIAVANVQWIAGLNVGKLEGGGEGEGPAAYLPVSMVYGVGQRSRGSWTKIPGSVCNGFSASRQFKIKPITPATDLPIHFDDEAYIAHSLPYLAALARLEAYRSE
ncbi:hypothetical protein HNQ40_002074 [Algisphaera agarilytica]|uniref:Cellulase Ig-like domain-containing protein n=2 Tax=Algisphaera agarilytica TaxID=1385975 RepID=A0A7X0H6N4_9BACT|nr:hypothetical protein [Algisphaera agarilytica]